MRRIPKQSLHDALLYAHCMAVQVIAARLVELGLANLLLATAVSPSAGSSLVQVREGRALEHRWRSWLRRRWCQGSPELWLGNRSNISAKRTTACNLCHLSHNWLCCAPAQVAVHYMMHLVDTPEHVTALGGLTQVTPWH
jgi:hypothetical protein